jgi:hypothetical protein
VLGAALAAAVGCAAASAAQQLTSNQWAMLARKALLLRRDLPPGWSSSPAPKKVPGLTCDRFHPGLTGIKRRAAVASSTFSGGSGGPFVAQNVYEFDSPGDALRFWHRVLVRRELDCVAEALQRGSGQGVTYSVTGKQPLGLPRLADRRAGYRVHGTATQVAGSLDVFLDMVVVAHGTAVSAISYSSLEVPPDRALELRFARTVARRLGNASAT